MLSNKDIRIENGYIIINGEKYPIVQDVSALEEAVEGLESVETITATGNYDCSYTAYKNGRIIQLHVTGIKNAQTSQLMTLFNLPAGWRPIMDFDVSGKYNRGSFDIAGGNGVGFRIENSGKVVSYSYNAFIDGNFDVTYISES